MIGPFGFQVRHHAFFAEVEILSVKEQGRFEKPTCRVVWNGLSTGFNWFGIDFDRC